MWRQRYKEILHSENVKFSYCLQLETVKTNYLETEAHLVSFNNDVIILSKIKQMRSKNNVAGKIP